MNERQNSSFLTEALVISVSNFIVKIIGVAFRIPISNMLDENMGIFNAAYSVYAMLYMVSTSGLPVAISRMVSASAKLGRRREAERVFRASMTLFGIIGLISTFAMIFGADLFTGLTKQQDSVTAMRVIAPTLFLICISSAIRGYFQGHRLMVPTAMSQLIEASFKMVVGIGATAYAKHAGYSPMTQAAFAISGITVGTVFSMAFLIVCKYFRDKTVKVRDNGVTMAYPEITAKLIKIAVPVTISASALYFSQFLDTLVIKNCLINSGVTTEIASNLYSSYTTLSLSLSDLLPSTLIYPIAISILPAVSAALAAREYVHARGYIRSSIRMTGIIALPCAFGLFAVARPCIALIYGVAWGTRGSTELIWNGKPYLPVDIGADSLKILALGIVFISMLSTTNALLQAAGKQHLPMVSIGIGVLFLIAAEVGLVSIPAIGIYGAPVASVICYIVALAANMYFMRKYKLFRENIFHIFMKPFFCALACGICAYCAVVICGYLPGGETRLNSLITLAAAGAIGVIVYVGSMLLVNGITADEVALLPKGRTISAFLVKHRILKKNA